MKQKLVRLGLVGCAVITLTGAGLTRESRKHALPQNDTEIAIARIFVTSKLARFTLLDLHRLASPMLQKHYKEFAEFQARWGEKALPSIEINTQNQEQLVSLSYGGRVGEGSWMVAFSREGKILSHWAGQSVDLHIDQTKREK
jgi:hypothetical protein